MRYRLYCLFVCCQVLLIASTGLVIFFQTCYSEAAHSSELQGEPWYTAMHDQSTLAKNWATSAVCNSTFDVFNPALVDAVVITLPATILLLVSLLSQLVFKKNPKKIPEMTIIGLLLLTVAIGCLLKSTLVNMQLRQYSYPTTYSIVPGVFFGCVASAFIATSGSVWMIWPGPETPEASHPASPEEIPLQRLDGHDLPPMIQPVRLQQASPAAGDDALQEDEQWRRLQTESETAAGVS
eukprot:scpid51673/ scgid5302/ 